jgi:hypothetical protein
MLSYSSRRDYDDCSAFVRLWHGRGTLLHYIGRVFLCLTGDRDNRPNAGEERSILGNHNRSNARIARVGEPPALSLGSELSNSLAPLRGTRIELVLPVRWNGASVSVRHIYRIGGAIKVRHTA